MATLTTRQEVSFTIEALKADGSPGDVQAGSVSAASSDETVIMVALDSGDQMKGMVSAVAESPNGPDGNPVANRFVVSADADLGAGVVTITGPSEDIFVTVDPRDQATTFRITLGTPQDKVMPGP